MQKQNNFLKEMVNHAFGDEKRNLLIICEEIGPVVLRTIQSVNETNKGAQISLMGIGEMSAAYTRMELFEDIAMYTGTEVYSMESFESKFTRDDVQFGHITTFMSKRNMSLIRTEEERPEIAKRVIELEEKISKLDTKVKGYDIKILKQRISMLSGKSIFFNLFALTESEFKTKLLRVEDAIKATQFTLAYGYVPGAGVFYRQLSAAMAKELGKEYTGIVHSLLGIEGNIKRIAKAVAGIPEGDEGYVINKYNGDYEIKDVVQEGIIDSAKVVENVIVNAFGIAKEIISIGTYIETVEEE